MTRLRGFAVVILLCLGAASISFFAVRKARSQTVTYQPFFAMKDEINLDLDSGASKVLHSYYAVRSDGSSVLGRIVGLRGGGSDVTRHLTILPDRGHIVNDRVRGKSTFFLTRQQAHRASAHRPQTGDCQAEAGFIRREEANLLGFRVIRFEAPDQRSNVWIAPDLGCYPLRTVTEKKDAQGHYRSEHVVKSVTVGEPPADLFRVPDSYTEMTPSDLISTIMRERGVSSIPQLDSTKRGDELYWSGRQSR